MQNTGEITADNTAVFTTSPLQKIDKNKLSNTAQALASQFHQESVAVFTTGGDEQNVDAVLSFPKPTHYSDIKKMLPQLEKLELSAFSVYFQAKGKDIQHNNISKIEWLTTPDKLESLEMLFPQSHAKTDLGEASLIYPDGREERLL